MRIKKISISNFRNIEDQSLEFPSHLVGFEGLNGQGKTNFVESIYFLLKGKSFRTPHVEHLINDSHPLKNAYICAEIESNKIKNDVSVSLLNGKKDHQINKKRSSPLKVFQNFPVILFSPESLSIIKHEPENRRNLLDETVLMEDRENLKIILDFKKSLRLKNSILRDQKEGKISFNKALDLMEGIQTIFLANSNNLVRLRLKTLDEIKPFFKDILGQLLGKNVDSSVYYVDKNGNILVKDIDLSSVPYNSSENIKKELFAGITLYGPQKHDMVFKLESKDSRFYGSQGQQRAIILAFKLTQILYHKAIYGYYPILILDDVLSEFDVEKKDFLLSFLIEKEAQAFLTATDIRQEKWVTKEFDRDSMMTCIKVLNGAAV